MSDELERSVELIERLLANPELRGRFRADPAAVLRENGLPELAHGLGSGKRALRTLELRESRSSLAGVMVASAAEGVNVAHLAERALPAFERGTAHAFERLMASFKHHAPAHHPAPKQSPGWHDDIPSLAGRAASPAAANGQVQLPQRVTGQPAQSPQLGSQAPVPANTPSQAHAGTQADVLPEAIHHHHHHRLLQYPGDGATLRQIAAWMAAHAKRAGLPPELPLMAALTESGLRNVPYGDRDSVGFFQMRESIWNFGPYANYLQRPGRQLKWFIDHALAVRAEDPSIAGDPSRWGEWAADVEQPAAQFRFRYQLQLGTAQELLQGVQLDPVPVAPPVSVGETALRVAMHYLGTPYQYGGSSPATGFDCSGLLQYSYAREGINLPRVAAEQFDVGTPVARDQLRPGDAVFFADPGGYVHHVGLYIGDGRFIDAPRTGEDVRVDSLSEPYFADQYAGARRYTALSLSDPSKYARTLPTVGS